MNQYIVIAEWNASESTGEYGLERLLDSNFNWVKLTSHSYIIKSNNTPVEIRNFLTVKYPSISRLFIGEMNPSAAWKNMLSESEMIKELFNNEQ